MDNQARKAAIAAYKERVTAWGVYAVQCTATGEAWVGCSRHIDTQQNGLWFALRTGACTQASLQAAWTAHGETEFRSQELDRLRPDHPELSRRDELRKRAGIWATRLSASVLNTI